MAHPIRGRSREEPHKEALMANGAAHGEIIREKVMRAHELKEKTTFRGRPGVLPQQRGLEDILIRSPFSENYRSDRVLRGGEPGPTATGLLGLSRD